MANTAFSQFVITGDRAELEALAAIMRNNKQEYVYGNNVAYIVKAVNGGVIPNGLNCNGEWSYLSMNESGLWFDLESEWQPLYKAWDFIASKFNTISVWFSGNEPDMGIFLKRDHPVKQWFKEQYFLGVCDLDEEITHDFFVSKEELIEFFAKTWSVDVKSTADIRAVAEKWNSQNPNCFVDIARYKTV